MDIKEFLQKAVELGIYDNFKELMGAYFIEAEVLKDQKAKKMLEDVKEEARKIFDEYGVDGDTPFKEILKKMN